MLVKRLLRFVTRVKLLIVYRTIYRINYGIGLPVGIYPPNIHWYQLREALERNFLFKKY